MTAELTWLAITNLSNFNRMSKLDAMIFILLLIHIHNNPGGQAVTIVVYQFGDCQFESPTFDYLLQLVGGGLVD